MSSQHTPKEAAIEELFYFKNAKTVIGVAQARGVLLHACAVNNLAVAEYTPLRLSRRLPDMDVQQKNKYRQQSHICYNYTIHPIWMIQLMH